MSKYVSFRALGAVGDMCSQMQQYASLYAVAKENGFSIVFPEETKNERHTIRLFSILDIEHEYKPDSFFQDFQSFELESYTEIDDRVFHLGNSSYFIDGRFDSFKYWYPKYKDDILSWKIHQHLIDDANNYITSLKKMYEVDNVVSIHIRLGDYLHPQHHHFTKLWQSNYYQSAMNHFVSSKTLFIVFTNDINFCKENILGNNDDDIFVNTGNDSLDFTIMSMCDSNIIANSSFSLWAAFMNRNPNKKIICPKNYVMDYSSFRHINGNYYPSDWIAIDNDNR